MGKLLPMRFKNNENAIAPIMGAVLITLLTIVLASLTAVTLYDSDAVQSLRNAFGGSPRAVIEIKEIVGGVPNDVRFEENYITLVHKSGDSLSLESTSIILSGEGGAYVGAFGETGSHTEKGDLVVKYTDLTPVGKDGKYVTYADRNPIIDDVLWSTGEQLILNGYDGDNTSTDLSVFVTVNGLSNTSNHYGFKADTIVTVKVFDEKTECIIAEDTAFVHLAE